MPAAWNLQAAAQRCRLTSWQVGPDLNGPADPELLETLA